MDTGIPLEYIDTACVALRHRKQFLLLQLEGIEHGHTRRGKKEYLEEELAEVEKALEVFEQLLK